MTTLPLVALLCLLVPVPAQGPARAQRGAVPATTDDPAFAEVEARYKSDLQIYDQARVDAAGGHGVAPTSHPATQIWPRMEALAQKGSVRARQWLCEHLAEGVTDPARRLAVLERELDALLACCAESTALFAPITALKTQSAVFGADKSLHHLDRIADGSTNPEVQARALLEQALLVSDRGRNTDVALRARAVELQQSVVLAFPATRAGRDAAEMLNIDVQRDFVQAMTAWLDTAAELHTAGRPLTEWPPNPLHAFRARFEPLAATQFLAAKSWVESLYPGFVQAEKLGPELALSSLSRDLGRYYPLRDPSWGRIRMRLLGLAVRVSGGEAPWILGSVNATAGDATELVALAPLPFTRAVIELSPSPEARAQAYWIEAQTRLIEGSESEFLLALEALDAIVQKHKDMVGLVEKAAALASDVRAVMPGAPLPDSRTSEWALKDLEDLELVLSGYRGRVLVIDVFDAFDSEFGALAPERAQLAASLAGRPFDLVGLCRSRTTIATARATFEKLGVTWRTGLLQGSSHPYLLTLFARRVPTATILVDAQGVIRARNRPFAELARLASDLTAEAERAAPKK